MNSKEVKVYVDKMTGYITKITVGHEFEFQIKMSDGSKAYVNGELIKKFPVKRYRVRVVADRYRLTKEKASKKELSSILIDLLNNLENE